MRAKLEDVARQAGVSKAAASYVLNGTGRVGQDARRRVEDAARRLGYRAYRPARDMASGVAAAIGAVLSPTRHEGEVPNYFVAELLAGAEEEARRHRYQLRVAMWDGRVPGMARDGSVGALLYLGGAFPPEAVAATPLPSVLVGTSFPRLGTDAVLADNVRGAYLAARHLLDAGCRRVGLVNGPATAPTSGSKWLGVRQALTEAGTTLDDGAVADAEFSADAGWDAARALLTGPRPPDGLLAADDTIAAGVLHAARDLGIGVPSELAVVGYGDGPLAAVTRPALSSVRVFQRRMAALAVRRLLERLREPVDGYVRTMVEPDLIVRRSSDRRHSA